MKKLFFGLAAILSMLSISSCSKYMQSGNGGFSDVSLNRNSDEYSIKRLKTIELDGDAVCGIPGLLGSKNNKNKNKTGMIFRFNGIEIGRTPRILPILTMIGFTGFYSNLVQQIGGKKVDNYGYNEKNKIPTGASLLIGLPFAGVSNNLLWNGIAASGLTNQMYYKLVDENPDVDVFINPKYKVDYKLHFFTQNAKVKADVTGATLKMK